MVGIRWGSFLLRLDTPVGRNMFLVARTNVDTPFPARFEFVPGKSYMIYIEKPGSFGMFFHVQIKQSL